MLLPWRDRTRICASGGPCKCYADRNIHGDRDFVRDTDDTLYSDRDHHSLDDSQAEPHADQITNGLHTADVD